MKVTKTSLRVKEILSKKTTMKNSVKRESFSAETVS